MMIARFHGGNDILVINWRNSLFSLSSVIFLLLTGRSAALALLAGLFLIETDQGTIRIETNQDVTVPVRIRQGENLVERLTVTGDGATAQVRAGTYMIEIEGENHSFEVNRNQAVVNAGDVWIARIELVPTDDKSLQQQDDLGQAMQDPQAVSPEFPPVKISVRAEDGKPLPGTSVRMRALDRLKRDVLLEVNDTSAENGVAIDRVLPFGKYYVSVKTADGWHTSAQDLNVEFEKGIDLTFVAPSPDEQAELLMEGSASDVDPSSIASLPFGAYQLHSRNNTSWTEGFAPEPGSDAGDYASFPTAGNGIEQVALSIKLDVQREIPQPSGQAAQWSWAPEPADQQQRFLFFNACFHSIAAVELLHAVPVEDGAYFDFADARERLGGTVMTLAEPLASPLSLHIPAGEVTVYVQGMYGRPSEQVIASLRGVAEKLSPAQSVWLQANVKLESAWIEHLLDTRGWTYRRSGDQTYQEHLVRRTATVDAGETFKLRISQKFD